ncbi:hypothetical protein [Methylogaea oryzae]|uniref:hypothetical protein n=1 Tax=Methylogaea oryzae TaxID=1295382 RepID=UPI0006D1F5A4|nr:hypothetical protein [Methylogaea oryzae]
MAWRQLLENARRNLPYCRKSLKDLPPLEGAKARSGIVISAGPSLHRTDALHKIKASGYPAPSSRWTAPTSNASRPASSPTMS